MTNRISRGAVLAAFAGSLLGSPLAFAETPKTVQADCSNPNKTIAKALEKGKEDRTLIVVVNGVCNENVVIDRADVTLLGVAGAAINGTNAALNVVTITADRVAIENLVVSGGLNGILATGAGNVAVRGTTVQSTGRSGIVAQASSGLLVDGSTVQMNPRDGMVIEGSQATILNSTVSQNGRFGIFIGVGASSRIGVDPGNNPAGNTVSQNGANGITVSTGGSALIGNNSITFNGADPASTSGRTGISVQQAAVDIVGGNTIANNAGQGIFARAATVQIGNTAFSPTVNTISGNGNPAATGGILGTLGSSFNIRDAVITGNVGFGVSLSTRTVAQITSTQIQGTVAPGPGSGDGIRLTGGAALLLQNPPSSVTGNAGAGFTCFGSSIAANTALLGSVGNGAPDVPCAGPF